MPMFGSKEESEPTRSDKKKGVTVGRAVNFTIFLVFVCILVSALVVVGTLGVTQSNVASHPEPNNSHHSCILYSYSSCNTLDNGSEVCKFNYSNGFSCEFVIVGFSFITLISLVFIVITCIQLVLASDIRITVIAELIVMITTTITVFVMGVVLSIGIFVTCRTVLSLNKDSTSCNLGLPYNNAAGESGPLYYATLNHSQAAAWLCFGFWVLLLVFSVLRVIVYVRRRKKSKELGGEVLTAEDNVTTGDDDEDSKPV